MRDYTGLSTRDQVRGQLRGRLSFPVSTWVPGLKPRSPVSFSKSRSLQRLLTRSTFSTSFCFTSAPVSHCNLAESSVQQFSQSECHAHLKFLLPNELVHFKLSFTHVSGRQSVTRVFCGTQHPRFLAPPTPGGVFVCLFCFISADTSWTP